MTDGNLSLNEKVSSQVETLHRNLSAAHQSATHLLHAALKHVLEHVSEPHAINVSPTDVRPIDFCGEFLLAKKLFHLVKGFHPSLPPHAQKLFQA